MSNGIREELETYLYLSYSQEALVDYMAALMLFDAFEFSRPYEVFADILFDTSDDDPEETRDKITNAFHKMLDGLFSAHRINLLEDVDLQTKNTILGALFRLQNFEDPTPILLILESDRPTLEKFARIIETMTSLDEGKILSAIEDVDESSLKVLQNFLYKKEETAASQETDEDADKKKKLVDNLKDFFTACGEDNLAFQMVQNGIIPGHELRLYHPYVKEMIESTDEDQTAKNILSFFFMGVDSFLEPMLKYRNVSEQLVHGDATKIMRIETKMSVLLNKLVQYQKAKNDAKSISVVQHSA